MGYRGRNGGGTCVAGRIAEQIAIFDVISSPKAICKPILLWSAFT
jgi:hypothetical protein